MFSWNYNGYVLIQNKLNKIAIIINWRDLIVTRSPSFFADIPLAMRKSSSNTLREVIIGPKFNWFFLHEFKIFDILITDIFKRPYRIFQRAAEVFLFSFLDACEFKLKKTAIRNIYRTNFFLRTQYI